MANGQFSTGNSQLSGFLWDLTSSSSIPEALVARNFLIDEGVSGSRYNSYGQVCGLHLPASIDNWKGSHERYLAEKVRRPNHSERIPNGLDPNDEELCPETFCHIPDNSPYLKANDSLHLIRVEDVAFIAEKCDMNEETLIALARKCTSQMASPEHFKELDDLLYEWQGKLGIWPTFASFWQDVGDLFEPAADSEWPNKLRNRLGLYHLNPSLLHRHPNVFVFRYPVKVVPRLTGRPDTRPLVPPTVLDGGLSPAFCPVPRDATTEFGYTVHLQEEVGNAAREILHPTAFMSVAELYQVGTITQSLTLEELHKARAMHIYWLQDSTGRVDYATDTDCDPLP